MSKKRQQKNLRMSEEHAEALEKLASDLFGSKKKQGQVVEHLIDLTEYSPNQIKAVIDEDKADNSPLEVDSADPSPSSHTQHSDNSSEDESEEITLENMKGRNVDHASVIYEYLCEQGDVMTLARATEIVEDEAGYSRYRAKQKAEKAVRKYEYKVDTEEVVDEYKRMIMNDYTNLMGNHTAGDISTSEKSRLKEFQKMDVGDLFGVKNLPIKYTNKELVAQKLMNDWLDSASRNINSTCEKVLKKAVNKVIKNDI